MTRERWEQILGNIKDNFEIEEHEKEYIKDEGGIDIEYVIFQGPLGRMRLEFVEKRLEQYV